MCVSINLMREEVVVSTIGGLHKRGWVLRTEDVSGIPWHLVDRTDCLCYVDVEAVLDRAGVVWAYDEIGDIEVMAP